MKMELFPKNFMQHDDDIGEHFKRYAHAADNSGKKNILT